jgi:uncharacterized protein YegL
MPRLMATSEDQIITTPGPGNFQFSAVRIEDLGATEYTLVTIVCDISGSVKSFAVELLQCIKTIVEASQKNPRSENLLLRLIVFNHDITEIHGFKNLSDIDVAKYKPLDPDGFTALYDASYDAIGATLEYSKRLVEQDFDCNGAVYIITDGMNNRGSMTPSSIAEKCKLSLGNEEIESLVTILIGLHDPNSGWSRNVVKHLKDFRDDAELTEFIDVGDATAQKLAKLANWVSESVSSQSQALGTGAPSQSLTF